jgi:hypothetical protein
MGSLNHGLLPSFSVLRLWLRLSARQKILRLLDDEGTERSAF